MSEKIQETVLSNLADDLAGSFFEGSGSSSNIILPTEEPKATDNTTDSTKQPKPALDKPLENPEFDIAGIDLLDGLLTDTGIIDTDVAADDSNTDAADDKRGPGRPRKNDGELGFEVEALFEDELLFPFEDESPVKSVKDLKELIKGNLEEARNKAKTESLEEYKNNLPPAVKYILDYTENGGDDIESLLKNIGQARQIDDLDIEQPSDQKEIIRQYLGMTGWSPTEIEEEIESLLDISPDKLKSYASKLKPKLDRQQEEALNYKLEQAKQFKAQQEQARQFYVSNVVDTLKKGSLGDIKLTKEEQRDIYSALIEERYQSVNGSQTNRLGALLDKIQFSDKPDYALLAEITLLASDPVAYRAKVREQIKKEVTAETVKTIKGQQGLKKAGSTVEQPNNNKTIKRLGSGFVNPF